MTTALMPVSFPALGTTATVVVEGGQAAVAAAVEAVRADLVAVDQACSRFRADSELSRVNAARGQPVVASALFLEAVDVATRAARMTEGLVDPTIGRAVRQLGYDRDFAALSASSRKLHPAGSASRRGRSRGLPLLTLLLRPAPGWQVITVDRTHGTIAIPVGVQLDLGATAKAWAADRAARTGYRVAHRGVLVSLGGDVAVAGPPPEGGWLIRVSDDHAAAPAAPGQTIAIATGGLATSGTTVRRWRHAGAEVHHLVDPATGHPVAGPWRTVSVAAGSCVDANTASTAAIVLGTQAPDWLVGQRLPARLVAADGTVRRVGGWPEP